MERKWFQEDERDREKRDNKVLQLEQQVSALEQRRKNLLIEHNKARVFENSSQLSKK